MNFLDQRYFGAPLVQWLIATVVGIGAFVILMIVRRMVGKHLHRLAMRTANDFDDVIAELIGETKILFLLVLGLYIGFQIVTTHAKVEMVSHRIMLVTALFQTGVWGGKLVRYFVTKYFRAKDPEDRSMDGTIAALSGIGSAVLWIILILLILDNIGFNITALVTGLGIGGIALALAVQSILSDLFASLSIILDKPFVVGDFIRVEPHAGTIEHIGLKTTRIRSLTGEQLVISNADLLKTRIQNFKRMEERRILFTVGVVYQTPHATIQDIPSMLKEAVETEELVRFDRAHFKEFGASALLFEVVYFVLSPDYAVMMEIQQRINMKVHKRFLDAGIDFAYPTQTVFIRPERESDPGHAKGSEG